MFKNKGFPTFLFLKTHGIRHNIIFVFSTLIEVFDCPIASIELSRNILYITPFCLQRPCMPSVSSLWLVFCIVQSNKAPKCYILMPYPSPWICRGVHEASTILHFLFQTELHALLRPPTHCVAIFSPCRCYQINPKKCKSSDGDAIASLLPKVWIPKQIFK